MRPPKLQNWYHQHKTAHRGPNPHKEQHAMIKQRSTRVQIIPLQASNWLEIGQKAQVPHEKGIDGLQVDPLKQMTAAHWVMSWWWQRSSRNLDPWHNVYWRHHSCIVCQGRISSSTFPGHQNSYCLKIPLRVYEHIGCEGLIKVLPTKVPLFALST